MKRLLIFSILLFLVLGCSKQVPIEDTASAIEEEKTVETPDSEEETFRTYEMRITGLDTPSTFGEGTIVKFRFRPGEIMIKPGETIEFVNADALHEQIRLVQTKKEDNLSKFVVIKKRIINQGDFFEYTFEKPGTYKALCSFHGCVAEIIVEDNPL